MNERLYDLCATLSDVERKEDRGAPFRSMHGTLNHLLLADRIWMARFHGETYPVRSLAEELYSDFEALREARHVLDGDIEAWTETLTKEKLASVLAYTSVVNPQPRTMPYWFAVQHFFNHQTHHRGQLSTLLEQAGCDIGVTDLMWLPGVPTASE